MSPDKLSARERAARPRRATPPSSQRAAVRWRLDAPAPAVAAWAGPATWAVVALFGAALLAFTLGPHRVGDVFTESDFYGGYGPGALAIQHGRLDPARYAVVGPLYELVLAAGGFLVHDLFRLAGLVSLLAACATLVLWARVVRRHAGALAALLAVALLAANAQFFRYGWAATTDALALALEAGALALLLAAPAPPRRAALAGLVAGLGFLTRYTAVALLPAALVALLAGWTETPAPARRAAAFAYAAGFLAPVAPWVAFSLVSGAHFAFQLHHNIAYEVFAHARGITWDDYQRTLQPQFPTPWSVIARDPGAVFSRVLFNVFDHLRLDATKVAGWPLAVAALAGLWLGRTGGVLARLAAVWLTTALLFLALVPAFHSERYSLALLPAWAALAAIALASPRFALVFVGGARATWLKPALALALLVPALEVSVAVQRRALSQLPLEVIDVARAARPFVAPGERVYARKPHFAWVAGLTATAFPFAGSLASLADDARRDHVRWLYFSWPDAETRPQFAYLLDTTSAVPGLTARATSPGHPAVLYEIGPEFGREPDWSGDAWARDVHRARAMLQIDARDWRSRLVAATDAQRHGRWSEAQPWLEQAARITNRDPEVVLLLAENDVHTGRLEEAQMLFDDARKRDPQDPRPQLGLGWVAALGGDTARAAEEWRPVIEAARDAETLARMASVFAAQHDDAAGAAVAARAREIGARP